MMLYLTFLSLVTCALAETSSTKGLESVLVFNDRLLNNNENNYSWMSDYEIKFESCVTMPTFEREGMRNQALIKFKLCPASDKYCSATCAGPEYIVEGKQFLYYIVQAKCDSQYTNCASLCSENARNYDGGNTCMANCYEQAGLSDCLYLSNGDNVNNNNHDEMFECRNGKGERNNHNNNHNNNNDGYYFSYYTGAFCSEGGNAVYMGTFEDQSCTQAAPEGSFKEYYGYSQPFSSTPIISSSDDCVKCQDQSNNYNAIDTCGKIYEESGKCESQNVPSGIYYPDTSACSFISSYFPKFLDAMNTSTRSSKAARSSSGRSGRSSASTVFAWIFFFTTIGLAAILIQYQRKKKEILKKKAILLAQDKGTLA